MSHIQVLGTGCPKCGHLMTHAAQAAEQLGRGDTVEKVVDIVKILEFSPQALPALAIDGTVATAGTIPSVTEIKAMLEQSQESEVSP